VRESSEITWWRESRQLALSVILLLAAVALLPVLFADHPGDQPVLGMRFGTFVGAILVPLAALAAVFIFAAWQRALDRRHDVADS
jgi:putative solute:sodium symporter small subunit